jgi:NAD(P)-dependent dehydrogenase (short-subunit alcohol dehydrogenase family)
MRGLTGKIAVVTGAGRGIGAATARRLSEEGASVVVVDVDGDSAESVAKSLPGPAIAVSADVSTEPGVAAYHQAGIARFGRLDFYHLNAGIGGQWGVGLAEIDMSDYDRVTAVNQRGVFLGMREALRTYRSQRTGGAIVTTASTAGIVGGEFVSPYVGSKHAVVGFTMTGAVNGGPLGVRVNCVAPGLCLTRLTDVNESIAADAAEARAAQIATVPLGRAGTPEDIAGVVAFLLSDDAAYVSGVTILVDGGSQVDHPRARALSQLQKKRREPALGAVAH